MTTRRAQRGTAVAVAVAAIVVVTIAAIIALLSPNFGSQKGADATRNEAIRSDLILDAQHVAICTSHSVVCVVFFFFLQDK